MNAPAKPHWRDQFDLVRERLAREPRVLVASDFDGTLSDIVDHPERAVPHPAAAAALTRLSNLHPRVRLAVLSGRSLADLSKRLGFGAGHLVRAGNHGLEIKGDRINWVHPAVASCRQDVLGLESALMRRIRSIPGVEIENKEASLTVHYRRVDAGDRARLLSDLERVEIPPTLKRHTGRMVVEFRPDVEWHKGFALRAILGLLGIPESAVVYLGDDTTDEDVFREFRTSGTTVQIGTAGGVLSARLRAESPADAADFLSEIARIL